MPVGICATSWLWAAHRILSVAYYCVAGRASYSEKRRARIIDEFVEQRNGATVSGTRVFCWTPLSMPTGAGSRWSRSGRISVGEDAYSQRGAREASGWWYSRKCEVNKKTLQSLAQARVADARTLLNAKRFDAAYYLAGYAIECALKVCIAKKTKPHDFPDKEFARRVFTHDLEELAELAGLMKPLRLQFRQDAALESKWGIVKDWSAVSRYELVPQREAAVRQARC